MNIIIITSKYYTLIINWYSFFYMYFILVPIYFFVVYRIRIEYEKGIKGADFNMNGYVCTEVRSRGGIRSYRRSPLTGKIELLEEYKTIPLYLRRRRGLALDEMAQTLFDDHVISEPTENCLLNAIDSERINRRNGGSRG